MTNEEKVKEMFPFYLDMDDIEVAQTTFKRAGAIEMAEWKDEQYATVVANLLVELDELKHQVKSLLP